ncbi:unnamed protein product [Coffea canephora]|uniref:Uncharacterized protein n=1 Tax=Coffea canephora TaxID=49390 RepID=A0A068V9P4_COFCA|nr:unnamed protein product [Coffea canephora]
MFVYLNKKSFLPKILNKNKKSSITKAIRNPPCTTEQRKKSKKSQISCGTLPNLPPKLTVSSPLV